MARMHLRQFDIDLESGEILGDPDQYYGDQLGHADSDLDKPGPKATRTVTAKRTKRIKTPNQPYEDQFGQVDSDYEEPAPRARRTETVHKNKKIKRTTTQNKDKSQISWNEDKLHLMVQLISIEDI
jgi:hypothetical protein